MKKILTFIYWSNYLIMMLIPFLLVFAARYHYAPFLDNVPYFSMAWLLSASIFLTYCFIVGMKIQTSPMASNSLLAKDVLKETVLIGCLSLLGIGFWFVRDTILSACFWDILMAYWVFFSLVLCNATRKFVKQCQNEKILPS